MRKSKNRYFYHIFVSPGDAPGAITLNVVRMEREFDAYKLSRFMCPSTYNRLWDRARYLWKKILILSYPLHLTPPLGGFPSECRHPLWYEKLEWCRYLMVKKLWRYVYSFWLDPRVLSHCFSCLFLSLFLSFLHEVWIYIMYHRWPALIAYSSLATSGKQLSILFVCIHFVSLIVLVYWK